MEKIKSMEMWMIKNKSQKIRKESKKNQKNNIKMNKMIR